MSRTLTFVAHSRLHLYPHLIELAGVMAGTFESVLAPFVH